MHASGNPSASRIETLTTPCPKCGGEVVMYQERIQCQKCDLNFPQMLAGRKFARHETEQLLASGTVGPLQGFYSKVGKLFAAVIKLTPEFTAEFESGNEQEDGKIAFENSPFKVSPRIVVVDDDAGLLQLMEWLIKQWFRDAVVVKFQDGDAAWRELLRAEPDVFITDLQRPGEMDGWKMISLLAEKKVKFPIVVVTGYTKGPDLDDKTLSDDVQDLLRRVRPALNVTALAKPFTNESFQMALELLLKVHSE